MLPMRYQYPPGLGLLIAAPLLLAWIGVEHGPWFTIAGVLGFVSMFRHPLRYLLGRVFNPRPEVSE